MNSGSRIQLLRVLRSMPMAWAASSWFLCVRRAAMAASFFRPYFAPCPFTGGNLGGIWGESARHQPQAASRPSPNRLSFALVDFVQNCLAFQAVSSDPCDGRAERGTKENDYDDFHH